MPSSTSNSNGLLEFTNTFKGKKVFVTGHTGFKGSWLCEWLLSLGAEVHGFSLPGRVSEPSLFDQLGLAERVNDVRGDIRQAQSVKDAMLAADPDFVFHLAAQPLVRLSYQQPVQTWETNVLGTIHVLEALRALQGVKVESLGLSKTPTSTPNLNTATTVAVLITTDKVYENREWVHGYREVDPLGGYDPYSSSKAGAELAIASWRQSYFPHHPVRIASARAGNVIGGGDWAQDRIVPDIIRALSAGKPIPVRNKTSTRPWQHVLEPLSGYLLLAARVAQETTPPQLTPLCSAFNFGPHLESNKTVKDLVEEALKHWPGSWEDRSDPLAPHEAGKLNLVWDKAHHFLGWSPRWGFAQTVEKTLTWYREVHRGACPAELTRKQIAEYSQS